MSREASRIYGGDGGQVAAIAKKQGPGEAGGQQEQRDLPPELSTGRMYRPVPAMCQ